MPLETILEPDGLYVINRDRDRGYKVTFREGAQPLIEEVEGWVEILANAPALQIPKQQTKPKQRKGPSLWERAHDFAKAGASRIREGSVSLPVLNHRRAVCLGVDGDGNRVSDPCRHAHEHKDGHWYCRSCGCPKWKLAQLDGEKLKFPALTCPTGKWSAL